MQNDQFDPHLAFLYTSALRLLALRVHFLSALGPTALGWEKLSRILQI